MKFLYIFLGGGLGSILRYSIGLLPFLKTENFPWATLCINVLACAVLGFFARYFPPQSEMRFLWMTGFCGGFSTFSTFSQETITLYQNGHTGLAFLYVFLSLVLGLAAFAWVSA